MKLNYYTKFFIGIFAFASLSMHAQQWSGTSNISSEITRTGRVGIGLTDSPNNDTQLYVRGNALTSPALKVGIVSDVNYTSDFKFGVLSAVRRRNTKAFSIIRDISGTGNFQDTFNVMGDGRVISGTNTLPAGSQMYVTPNSNLSISSNIYSRTAYTTDFRFGIVSAVNRANTKAFAVLQNQGGTLTDTFSVLGDGNVLATEVRVRVPIFPDYVFADSYDLMPLSEVETFIKKNKHLPNIPKASKVTKEGMKVGDMQVKQMEKIEELYLHIIQLEKRIKELESKK